MTSGGAGRQRLSAGNGGQGAAASLAFLAFPATGNLQLAESKGGARSESHSLRQNLYFLFNNLQGYAATSWQWCSKLVLVSAEMTAQSLKAIRICYSEFRHFSDPLSLERHQTRGGSATRLRDDSEESARCPTPEPPDRPLCRIRGPYAPSNRQK
jgi:hypothetical protein